MPSKLSIGSQQRQVNLDFIDSEVEALRGITIPTPDCFINQFQIMRSRKNDPACRTRFETQSKL